MCIQLGFTPHSISHGTTENNSLHIYTLHTHTDTHDTHTHTLLFLPEVQRVLYCPLPAQRSAASYLAPHQQATTDTPHRYGNTMREVKSRGRKKWETFIGRKGTFPCSKLNTLRKLQSDIAMQRDFSFKRVRSCHRLILDTAWKSQGKKNHTDCWGNFPLFMDMEQQHQQSYFLKAHTLLTDLINLFSNHPKFARLSGMIFIRCER